MPFYSLHTTWIYSTWSLATSHTDHCRIHAYRMQSYNCVTIGYDPMPSHPMTCHKRMGHLIIPSHTNLYPTYQWQASPIVPRHPSTMSLPFLYHWHKSWQPQ